MPALLFITALMFAASSPAWAADGSKQVHVDCAQGRNFGFRIEGRQARVQLADGELVLARKPSSLGQQYRNRDATLILDDGFVAFVQRGDWDWQDCHIAQPSSPDR